SMPASSSTPFATRASAIDRNVETTINDGDFISASGGPAISVRSRWRAGRQPRTIVIEAEQIDDGLHIVLAANAYADPPRVREDMVTLRAARGDELRADRTRKEKMGRRGSLE